MKARIVDRNNVHEYDNMRKVSIKDGKLTIVYIENGEEHVERGPIPDELLVEKEELHGSTEYIREAATEAWKEYSENLSKKFFDKQNDNLRR